MLLFAFSANSQTKITQVEKDKQIGLVWGLLKYHHPDISKGLYNWDFELLHFLEKVENLDEQEKLNTELLVFIKKFNKPKTRFKNNPIKINSSKIFKKNLNYDWIEEIPFDSELRSKLTKIKNNNAVGDYYASLGKLNKMLSFSNEKGIENFKPKLKNHRLLEFFSFWNIIQYWNVNKYLTDSNWLQVLEELTAVFSDATTIDKYEVAKLKMFAKLNDSHSYMTSMFYYNTQLNFGPTFGTEIINDSIKVTSIYNKTLSQNDTINLGDVILEINDLSVTKYINDRFSELFSSSNKTYLRELINRFVLRNNKNSLKVKVLRKNGRIESKTITLYKTFKVENFERLFKPDNSDWRKIAPKISCINLSKISSKKFAKVFKENKNDEAIILDLRNYPKHLRIKDFSKVLFPNKKTFIKVLLPVKSNPSYGELGINAPLKIIADPFKVGKKNSNYYKGKIVLLVNRKTGSMAEYFGMAIQQSPNCITIGEQTMGAVMNIASATLPDKQKFYFTGAGAFYPNGDRVQRNGLKIDYYIKESAINYNPNLYIEQAIKIIKKSIN